MIMSHPLGCMKKPGSVACGDTPTDGIGGATPEPLLSAADLRIWRTWELTAIAHARTWQYARRVDQARRVIARALDAASGWAVMWSGGKDSTAMAHLALGLDPTLELVSEKDDLDYPGERDYVQRLAAQWGARLTVLTPEQSPGAWIAQHGTTLVPDADVHARTAALSKACFYGQGDESGATWCAVLQEERAMGCLSAGRLERC